jgi:hypothetical protein
MAANYLSDQTLFKSQSTADTEDSQEKWGFCGRHLQFCRGYLTSVTSSVLACTRVMI